jgi:hypothetical protein
VKHRSGLQTVPDPKHTDGDTVRRHDLDALRAAAMLLGIAYHSALSFCLGAGWVVRDDRQSTALYVFQAFVHGFRMPLFMLLSGFFTAMLWRKRGLRGLLVNRCRRVLLPCFASLCTVVPAVHWAETIALRLQNAAEPKHSSGVAPSRDGHLRVSGLKIDWFDAISRSDSALVGTSAEWMHTPRPGRFPGVGLEPGDGLSVFGNAPDGVSRSDCSGLAPVGHSLKWRLDGFLKGSEISVQSSGILLESVEQHLLWLGCLLPPTDAGALEHKVSGFQPDAVEFAWDGALKRADKIDAKRFTPRLFTTGGAFWKGGFDWLGGPVFVLVWFLWFLVWYLPFFSLYACAVERFGWNMRPHPLFVSQWSLVWVVPLTVLPAMRMGCGSRDFGPETSMGLLPSPHVLAYYGAFFGFGVLSFVHGGAGGRLGRSWFWTLPIALFVVFPLALDLASGTFGIWKRVLPGVQCRVLAVVLQVLYAWLMSFSCIGLCSAFVTKESRAVRYLMDASYWCYLAHLPVVILVQTAVCRWALPAGLKFFAVFSVVIAVMHLSYQKLVRHRWIGTFLNGGGRRPDRQASGN